MTRVEKYREYRKEILNSFYFDNKETKKSIASDKVSKATYNKNTTNNLSVDEVMEAYQLYDETHEAPQKKKLDNIRKKEIIFFALGIIVVLGIIAALIVVGINAFGGN